MAGIKDKVSAGQDVMGIRLMGPDGSIKDHKMVSDLGEVTLTNEYLISKEFSNSNDFSQWIERQHADSGVSRMDLIIEYCQRRQIDIESISPLINRTLKERIRLEAEEARLMRPTGRLPL